MIPSYYKIEVLAARALCTQSINQMLMKLIINKKIHSLTVLQMLPAHQGRLK